MRAPAAPPARSSGGTSLGFPLLLAALLALCLLAPPASAQSDAAADGEETGIHLEGRTADAEPPDRWSIYDAESRQRVTYVSGRWGFESVPPGRYILSVDLPGQSETRYGEVAVRAGEVTVVRADSGIELSGHTPDAEPPERWSVYDAETNQRVTYVSGRWGFAAVPPGRYILTIDPSGQSDTRYGEVAVRAGEVSPVRIDSGIELSGRTDDAEPPERWSIYDAETRQRVTYVSGRWGIAAVSPGRYIISVDPPGQSDTRYGAFEVRAGEITPVRIDSGIELSGRTDDAEPPERWSIYDAETRQRVTYVSGRWGVAAVPPGRYIITVDPPGQPETRIDDVAVQAGAVTPLRVGSGIELSGRTSDAEPPERWSVYHAESRRRVTYVSGRWGFAAVPPGRYILTVDLPGQRELEFGVVDVRPGQVASIPVDSGIELWTDAEHLPAPEWSIANEEHGRIAGFQEWRLAYVPPGDYVVTVAGVPTRVTVEPGEVERLSIADLGLGLAEIELPAAKNVRIASGSAELEAALIGNSDEAPEFNKVEDGITATGVRLWGPAGSVTLRLRSGEVVIDKAVDLPSGEKTSVPFDAAQAAEANGLSLFGVTIRDRAGREATTDTQLVVMDGPDTPRDLERARQIAPSARDGGAPRLNSRLLALAQDPPQERLWLAPADVLVRARLGDHEASRRIEQPGVRQHLDFDIAPSDSDVDSEIEVAIEIQSPEEGELVTDERVTVTGRASTSGWGAGATRVAIVVDVSGSTEDSSGADLDGDGEPETILETETAAARILLDALEEVERSRPGTAFEAAVVPFSGGARVAGPLAPLSDAEGVESLRSALDEILARGPGGGTDFEAALDAAVEAFSDPEHRGEKVIVFLSDGLPNDVARALDAAARTGVAGAVIHGFGLGADFEGETATEVRFPPSPSDGPDILATVTAAAAPSGTDTALPNPADIVEVIGRIPVLELPEAELEVVEVVNSTTGEPAVSVDLTPDGFFEAEVPVKLLPWAERETNTLAATAIAIDGVTKATDQVTVRGERPGPGELRVVAADQPEDSLPVIGAAPRFELILDASGSMRQTIDGRPAIDVAKEVMSGIIDELPSASEVALRVYGHRVSEYGQGDCEDSELLFPFQRIDKERMKRAVAAVQVKGTTPLSYSLVQAAKDLVDAPGEKLIVLVTDGEEYCGADPEAVVQALVDLGMQVRVEVVGFALADDFIKEEMRRAAEATGGGYHDAQDRASLSRAVRHALAARFEIFDDTGERVGGGQVGGDPIEVAAGVYQVVVRAGYDELEIAGVRVTQGEVTEIDLGEVGQPAANAGDDAQDADMGPEEARAAVEELAREVVEAFERAANAGLAEEALEPISEEYVSAVEATVRTTLQEEGPVAALEVLRDTRTATRADLQQAMLDQLEREVVAARDSRPPRGADPRVHRAQRLLAAVGFDPGPADGLWGGNTAAAVRAFQQSHADADLAATGELDDATYRALIEAARDKVREQARGQ